ncbi:MAG: GNAT family N-acetyltransferase [Defluviitaleaceae bacterium]|nr:GNAT family N-acetyltransferase [Defluviitaleaceae bacterium]
MVEMKYVRIQGRENAYRTGKPVGIFSAVWRLQRAGLLTDEEKAVFHEIDQVWFQENLPNPPFYDDNEPGKPITWFKTATAMHMVAKLAPLMDMMEKYSKPYDVVYTNFPGRVVYEDEWQVAVYNDNTSGQINPLSTVHLPIYAEVIRKSFATVAKDYGLTFENCPGHWSFITDEQLAEKFSDNYYPFGYFTDGKLVGFASLTKKGKDTFEMNAVSILPEYRHFGYGKTLLEFCKRKVVELEGKKIAISLADTDTMLKKWYADNGFIYIGAEKFDHLPLPVRYMEWEADHLR